MFTQDQVKKLASLARIRLSDEEVVQLSSDMETILTYIEDLKNVNTDGLDIVTNVTGLSNIMREDVAVVSDIQRDLVAEAPQSSQGYYKVKSIL